MDTVPLTRGAFITNLKKLPHKQETPDDRFWGKLCNWIEDHRVVPLISGSLVYDLVFNPDNVCFETPSENEPLPKKTTMNLIAGQWAEWIGYQLPDKYELARVAQYIRATDSATPITPKESYLGFIKQLLLSYAADRFPEKSAAIDRLMNGNSFRNRSFSDLAVRELGLLTFGPDCQDPLSILARLPLPVYVTTSYHDLLELALEAMGKRPITQVCFWPDDTTQANHNDEAPRKQEPSVQTPLVYHLFGLEQYPASLVLTEDDYLDYLVKITETRKSQNPVIPTSVSASMTAAPLMLLGYRLQDWDFRTLFRGLITPREGSANQYGNTIIQLAMESQYDYPDSPELRSFFVNTQKYLQEYFNKVSFEIRWNDTICFLKELSDRWEGRV